MGSLKFGNYTAEDAAQEKVESDAAGGGAEFMKLVAGRNVVRVLPPPPGQRSVFKVVYQHFVTIGGQSKSVLCARIEAQQHCDVCAKIAELRSSPNATDQELAKDFGARRRVFVNVIDRKEEAKGPKVMGIGKQVHEQMLALRTDEDAGGDWSHPVDGFDLIITRTGTGKNDTKYDVKAARNLTPLADSDDQMQEWIDTQEDLGKFAKLGDNTETRAMLGGGGGSGGAAKPRQVNANARPRGRRVEDDAIDAEIEEEDA